MSDFFLLLFLVVVSPAAADVSLEAESAAFFLLDFLVVEPDDWSLADAD